MRKSIQKALVCLIASQAFETEKLTAQGTIIPPTFYGVNAWETDYGDAPFGGSVNGACIPLVSSTKAKMIRVGGIAYSVERDASIEPRAFPHRTGTLAGFETNPAGYVRIVDDCRAAGFEPMLQVPFDDISKIKNIDEQAREAAEIVRVVNIVHKRNVKLWIIGNEPNESQHYTGTSQEAQIVRRYTRAYATQMKNMDPTIETLGPELSSADANYLTPLCASPTLSSSISGTIDNVGMPGHTKVFINYLTHHRYGGFGSVFTNTTLSNRQRYVEAGHGLAVSINSTFTTHIKPLNIAPSSTIRTAPLHGAITEFNMHENEDITLNNQSSVASSEITGDDFNGNTFLAGQYVVDQIAAMLSVDDGTGNCPYKFSNIWSIREGRSLGLLHTNNNKKPTFWHFWMMSRYFNGVFFPNKKNFGAISVGDPERCYKAYAVKGADYIAVMLVNQTQTVSSVGTNSTTYGTGRTFTIDLGNGGNDMKFDMGLTGVQHQFTLAPSSTALLFFSCNGATPTGGFVISDSWVASNLTATQPATIGPVPSLGSLTNASGACFGSGANMIISAPVNSDWFLFPNLSTPITSGAASFTASAAGLYFAKHVGACGVDVFLSATLNDISPIVSRETKEDIRCIAGTGVNLSVENTSQSYTWSPNATVQTPYTNSVSASPTVNTIYSVSTSSSGCISTETLLASVNTNTLNTNLDLFIKDFPTDNGTPGHSNMHVYDSPDIFLSATPGGASLSHGTFMGADAPQFINVRVHNGTNMSSTGILRVYWAKFGIGQNWMLDWNNKTVQSIITNTNSPHQFITGADMVDAPQTITVGAQSTATFSLPWIVPNPTLFAGFPPGPNGGFHFCAVATIETCAQFPQSGWLTSVVMNSEKAAWKNFGVMQQEFSKNLMFGSFARLEWLKKIKAKLRKLGPPTDRLLNNADVNLEFTTAAYENWDDNGNGGTGIADLGENKIAIVEDSAYIDYFDFEGESEARISVLFTKQADVTDTFEVCLEEYTEISGRDTMVGGLKLLVLPPQCATIALVADHMTITPECFAEMAVANPDVSVEYNWYDEQGDYMDTGDDFSTQVPGATYFVVKAVTNGCAIPDTCFITIASGQCMGRRSITGITQEEFENNQFQYLAVSPNPVSEELSITYDLKNHAIGGIVMTNNIGKVIYSQRLDGYRHQTSVNCSELAAGLYQVSLIGDGKVRKSLKVAVTK
jgi:hypothetical protein